jgi:hypothetical protein
MTSSSPQRFDLNLVVARKSLRKGFDESIGKLKGQRGVCHEGHPFFGGADHAWRDSH